MLNRAYQEPTKRTYYHRPREMKMLVRSQKHPATISEQKRFLQRAARLFGCVDCRERDASCLSFYLRHDGRFKAIRIRHCRTVAEVKQELYQGVVLCSNCLKKRTAPVHTQSSWLRTYKATQGCTVCKTTNPDVLEFHHKVHSQKRFDISRKYCSVPSHVLKNELNKVIVLCANCHNKEHSS